MLCCTPLSSVISSLASTEGLLSESNHYDFIVSACRLGMRLNRHYCCKQQFVVEMTGFCASTLEAMVINYL